MKGVQCYELFKGIALKIHTFSFHFSFSFHFINTKGRRCHSYAYYIVFVIANYSVLLFKFYLLTFCEFVLI